MPQTRQESDALCPLRVIANQRGSSDAWHHCHPRAGGDPVRRGPSVNHWRLWNTGSPPARGWQL